MIVLYILSLFKYCNLCKKITKTCWRSFQNLISSRYEVENPRLKMAKKKKKNTKKKR